MLFAGLAAITLSSGATCAPSPLDEADARVVRSHGRFRLVAFLLPTTDRVNRTTPISRRGHLLAEAAQRRLRDRSAKSSRTPFLTKGRRIIDVARELGATRQAVYRYLRSTKPSSPPPGWPKPSRSSIASRRMSTAPAHPRAEVVVEAIAHTLDRRPHEPYMGLLMRPGLACLLSKDVTSETACTLGRTMLERLRSTGPRG